MKLVLVRHGESEHNKKDLSSGQLNPPLTQTGIDQAVACGKTLAEMDFGFVHTSVLVRAIHTAEIIIQYNQFNPKNILRSPDLNEKGDGVLEGINRQHAMDTLGDTWDLWKRTINHAPPDGESVEQMFKRVSDYYDNIIASQIIDNNVLIVSHEYTVRCFLIHLKKLPLKDIFELKVKNAHPYILEI